MRFRLIGALIGSGLGIAVGWAIWHLAPIGSQNARLLLSALPLIVWGVVAFLGRPLALTASSVSQIESLQEDVSKARTALRHRGLGSPRARYRVPLYMLLGPPGTGKSTIIEHSGLSFDPPIQIAAMTWWICDSAIIVECSLDGTSATDVDKMTAVVKSLRPRLPLNGVLFAVSPADLTLADETERRELSSSLGHSLRMVGERLNRHVPVYAILTKLDLIPGFSEFFDRLDPLERAQPWAFTLPYVSQPRSTTPEAVENAFSTGFRQLVAAIRIRLPDRMARELDVVRSGRMMGFAVQIAALEPMIRAILQPLLPAQGQRATDAFLRGLFLTSARQDALSIDPLLPQLSSRFGLPRSGMPPPDLNREEDTRDFFIKGAMSRGILPEAGLAARGVARWQWPQFAAMLIAAVVVSTAAAGGYRLYDDGRQALANADSVGIAAKSLGKRFYAVRASDLPAVLEGLDRIQEMSRRLTDGPSGSADLSVFVHPDALKADITDAYQAALTNSLAPHLGARLEGDLVDKRATIPALRGRLAAAQGSEANRKQALQSWLETQIATVSDPALRAAFKRHGDELLRRNIAIPVAVDYIRAAQRLLAYKESVR